MNDAALEAAFHAALDLDVAQRGAYLEALRTRDASLAAALEELLVHEERIGPRFLEGAPAAMSPDIAAEQRIGDRYVLRDEIGRGAQGVVYAAEDLRLGRMVAVKLLTATQFHAPERRGRFEREARVAARLDHPNLCAVYDAGFAGEVPWIAMRLVAGPTLAALLESRPRPAADEVGVRVEWFEKLARALHVAHEKGIVHRDIKPQNIVIQADGEPVLLDFGVAREDGVEDLTLTRTGSTCGTLAYMSPEALGGAAADPAIDTWALAVSAYEALAGSAPFQGATPASLIRSILHDEPDDLRRHDRSLRRDLDVVVRAALEKSRARRLVDVLVLAEELGRVRRGEPILSREAPAHVRLGRFVGRHPLITAGLAATLLALVTGLVISSVSLARERELRSERDELLSHYERLNDLALARVLDAQEPELWPVQASRLAVLDAWVTRADDLLSRRSQHVARLGQLEGLAGPWTPEQRAADAAAARAADPMAIARRDAIVSERAAMIRRRDASPESTRDVGDMLVAGYDALLAEIDARLGLDARRSFDFGDRLELAFQHDSYRRLVELDDALAKRRARLVGEIADVRTAAASREVAAAWEHCLADLAADPRFAALREPIDGLEPLGRHRDSGLWEFFLIASGSRPVWTGTLDAGATSYEDEHVGVVLVLLPGGSFRMGAQAEDASATDYDPDAQAAEGPVHSVELAAFLMAKFEVTQGQWVRVFGKNPSAYLARMERRNRLIHHAHPVTNMSWSEARDAAQRLGLELPTEEQWEYAARAGVAGPWPWEGGRAAIGAHANVADEGSAFLYGPRFQCEVGVDDGHAVHAPVGSFRANAFGLHDMIGNVSEWCRNGLTEYASPPRAGDGDRSPQSPSYYMNRGGSFQWWAPIARVSGRRAFPGGNRTPETGLRVCRNIVPVPAPVSQPDAR